MVLNSMNSLENFLMASVRDLYRLLYWLGSCLLSGRLLKEYFASSLHIDVLVHPWVSANLGYTGSLGRVITEHRKD